MHACTINRRRHRFVSSRQEGVGTGGSGPTFCHGAPYGDGTPHFCFKFSAITMHQTYHFEKKNQKFLERVATPSQAPLPPRRRKPSFHTYSLGEHGRRLLWNVNNQLTDRHVSVPMTSGFKVKEIYLDIEYLRNDTI